MGGAVVRLVPHVQRASCRVAEGDREGRGRGLPRPRQLPTFYTWQSVATRRSARAFRRVSGCFHSGCWPGRGRDALRIALGSARHFRTDVDRAVRAEARVRVPRTRAGGGVEARGSRAAGWARTL